MRWIKATAADGKGDVWINMAQVFTIQRVKADDGSELTEIVSANGGNDLLVVETPEHLVAPFR